MNKTRQKEYFKNTAILLIGKFATQFSSLLLIPLFTAHLTAADYGYVDLLQTYASLFIPVLILRFDSAVFRLLIDERNHSNKSRTKSIISTALVVITVMSLLAVFAGIILSCFSSIQYLWFIITNIVCLMYSGVLLQIARGLGHTAKYSVASIITAAFTLGMNTVLILCFNADASSILVSSIAANLACIVYITFSSKLLYFISLKSCTKNLLKEMLHYSLPMIPNSLSWWIINVSDRTVISVFLGTAMNGIYAVSCKFSNILNSIFIIFNMSWQESAALHINDPDRDVFFTDIINKLILAFSSISILIISSIPLLFDFLIGPEYSSAYTYIPILLFANIFNVAIQLFGAIYIAKKMTKQVMNTTLASAIINLIIDLSLVNSIGLYAACVSTLFANLALALYRYIDMQKHVRVKIKLRTVSVVLLAFAFCTAMYYANSLPTTLIGLFCAVLFTLFANKSLLADILRSLLKGKRNV